MKPGQLQLGRSVILLAACCLVVIMGLAAAFSTFTVPTSWFDRGREGSAHLASESLRDDAAWRETASDYVPPNSIWDEWYRISRPKLLRGRVLFLDDVPMSDVMVGARGLGTRVFSSARSTVDGGFTLNVSRGRLEVRVLDDAGADGEPSVWIDDTDEELLLRVDPARMVAFRVINRPKVGSSGQREASEGQVYLFREGDLLRQGLERDAHLDADTRFLGLDPGIEYDLLVRPIDGTFCAWQAGLKPGQRYELRARRGKTISGRSVGGRLIWASAELNGVLVECKVDVHGRRFLLEAVPEGSNWRIFCVGRLVNGRMGESEVYAKAGEQDIKLRLRECGKQGLGARPRGAK